MKVQTVGELIEALKTFPEDAPIGLSVWGHCEWALVTKCLDVDLIQLRTANKVQPIVVLVRAGAFPSGNGYQPSLVPKC